MPVKGIDSATSPDEREAQERSPCARLREHYANRADHRHHRIGGCQEVLFISYIDGWSLFRVLSSIYTCLSTRRAYRVVKV